MGGATTNGHNDNVNQPLQRKIALAIKSQDGDTVYFRVARDKKIKELLTTYCEGKNFKYHDMTFIHNGIRIQPTKTLIQLGIEDGDEIDAMGHHDGGGNSTNYL